MRRNVVGMPCRFVFAVIAALASPLAMVDAQILDSADGIWKSMDRRVADEAGVFAWIRPEAFAAFTLSRATLTDVLDAAPTEAEYAARGAHAQILLPMPDGEYAAFRFVNAPVMEPELAAMYPEIRTFLGQGIDDPAAVVRFDITPAGFHAQILSPSGAVYIDPLNRGDDSAHASYYKRDYATNHVRPGCTLLPNPNGWVAPRAGEADEDFLRTGETLRTYRLAVAATGEYTAFHGGTVSAGLAAIVTAVNRVTGIYEVELGIRMVLVANNNLVVYTDGATDPYSNGNGSAMLSQNQTTLNSVIGSANYDIGHVFSTGGGGVAFLGVVCTSSKAGGVTGQSAPIGDPFYVDYVAHEMGHQFGANHCFNGTGGNCAGGNRNASTAYEPGSGSTIMAYAGICGADNLQSNSDPYFHHDSFREIRNFITAGSGAACAANSATGNTDPTVEAGANYTIPRSTPFELTAVGSDPDGDPVTYCWEERDLGPALSLASPDNGSSPLFRSWNPTTNSTRVFPRLSNLLANTTPPGERLPTTNRTMNFRCTVRDQRANGGGVAFDNMAITINAASGPFEVTSPNTSGVVWNHTATVTWNVASTSSAPVSAGLVNILLSTDGGNTFPIVLAAGTPNDGSEEIIVPNVPTTTARVKVAAANNIFFDISNANFTIEESGALAIVVVGGAPASVPPGIPTALAAQVISLVEDVVPGSPTLHYRMTGVGAYSTIPMTALGGEAYEVLLPRAICGETPQFYFSAQGDGGTTVTNPVNAPTGVFTASVGIVQQIFADDFETNQGWTVSGNATDGQWERGVPENWDRGDPPADADGSGQCMLTDNNPSTSDSDVDNGTTTVTSPVLDLSDGGTIAYSYWLDDVPGGPLNGDSLTVELATDAAGTNWTTVRTYTTALGAWRTDTINVGSEVGATPTLRIRFNASDLGTQNVVEAGLDAVNVVSTTCPDVGNGDFDLDGDVDLRDFAGMQACWGQTSLTTGCQPGDLDGDDAIGPVDLEVFALIQSAPLP